MERRQATTKSGAASTCSTELDGVPPARGQSAWGAGGGSWKSWPFSASGHGELIARGDDRDAVATRRRRRLVLAVERTEAADLGQRAAAGQDGQRQDDGGRTAKLSEIHRAGPAAAGGWPSAPSDGTGAPPRADRVGRRGRRHCGGGAGGGGHGPRLPRVDQGRWAFCARARIAGVTPRVMLSALRSPRASAARPACILARARASRACRS